MDLSRNKLHGPVPLFFTHLDQLFRLSLTDNALAGALPLSVATFGAAVNTCQLEGNALCLPGAPPYASLGADPICGLPLEPSCRICEGPNCEALEDIYHATGGPAWSVHTGWLATSSPCEWFGASCSDGRLSSLALPNNGLNGALPEDIAKLQYLVELDFSRNALEGHVPAQIGALSRLSKLDLSVNNLAGVLRR